MSAQVIDCPVYEGDLFSDDALRDPFLRYQEVRDLGPVVYMPEQDFYLLSRFDDVRAALMAADRLISSDGNGLNQFTWDAVKAPDARKGVIISDGYAHKRLRAPLVRELAPGAIKQSRDHLKAMISEKVRSLVGAGKFDGVSEVAHHLPLAAISHLLGLPEEGRQNMLRWASATFNVIGVQQDKMMTNMPAAMEGFLYVNEIDRSSLRPGSWSAKMFELVDQGKLTEKEARGVIGDFMIPSLDTTIFAKANLLYNLGTNPEQWAKLEADPSLIRSAVFEGVRHSAVVRWFSRMAASDYVHGDVALREGSRVIIMYGSANRDERHYPDAEEFKVDRNPRDQTGVGHRPARLRRNASCEARDGSAARSSGRTGRNDRDLRNQCER